MNKSIKVILVCIILLALVALLMTLVKPEKFQNTCGFIPRGITLQECKDACNMKKNMGDEACDADICLSKCEDCSSSECLWKQDPDRQSVSVRTPLAPRIKAYSGDRQIKLAWVAPRSRLPITRYILVCETEGEATKFYYPSVSAKLVEYSLFNLENKREYKMRLFAENDAGVSVQSNTVSVKPQANKEIPIFSRDIENLADIDSSEESSKRNLMKLVKDKFKEKIGYDDEKRDYYELLKLINETSPKIDLQDENINIKFV